MGPASSLLAAQGTKMGFDFLKHWAGTEKIRVQSCALLLTRYIWGGLLHLCDDLYGDLYSLFLAYCISCGFNPHTSGARGVSATLQGFALTEEINKKEEMFHSVMSLKNCRGQPKPRVSAWDLVLWDK